MTAFSYRCLLDGSGYEVTVCPGPGGFPRHRCALLETGHCEQVSDADVVVNTLGSDRPSAREVLDALGQAYPDKPIIVKDGIPTSGQPSLTAEGWCRVSPAPVPAMSLLDSIDDAVAKPRLEND